MHDRGKRHFRIVGQPRLQSRRAVRRQLLDQRRRETGGRAVGFRAVRGLCFRGFLRRRPVLRADQAAPYVEIAIMADADHRPGFGLCLIGPAFLAFGQFRDPLLNLIEAVERGLILRFLAMLIDDRVALVGQRLDFALLRFGRRRARCRETSSYGKMVRHGFAAL